MLPILPENVCVEKLGGEGYVKEHMICAGYLEGGKDTCRVGKHFTYTVLNMLNSDYEHVQLMFQHNTCFILEQ